MTDFKDIFVKLRKEKGLNQEEIAKALGLSKSSIAMWETGSRRPSPDVYEQIADFFNVDMDFLYGRTKIRRKVWFDESGQPYVPEETYYLNEDAREIAQFMCENPEYTQLLVEIQKAKHSDFDTLRRLVSYFCKLNVQGKEEAEKRIHELSQIGIYVDVCTQEDAIKTMNKTWAAYCDEPIAAHNDHEHEPGELEKMQNDIAKLKRPE